VPSAAAVGRITQRRGLARRCPLAVAFAPIARCVPTGVPSVPRYLAVPAVAVATAGRTAAHVACDMTRHVAG